MIDIVALKNKILELAVCGRLTKQLESDGTAGELFAKIQAEKAKMIKEGRIKKKKVLQEIKDDEIPFKIPDNWKWVRFAELCEIINGDRGKNYPAKSTLKKVGIPFISALNLDGKSVIEDENLLCMDEEQYGKLGSGKLQQGDIIICIRGSLGKHGKYPFDKGAIASSLVISRVYFAADIIGDYEMLWLDSLIFQKQIGKYDGGTAQPNLAANNLEKFLFPLPPLKEQERIVKKVSEVFEILETIDELQSRYLSDAKVLKSKLIDAGIQGKLTEQLPEDGTAEDLYAEIQAKKTELIHEGKIKKEKVFPEISEDEIPFDIAKNWKWVRLGDISAKISSGNTPTGGNKSDAYVKEGYSFFREQNIYNDGIHEEGLVYIAEELLETRVNSTVLPMDILLNITGGSIGRCALIPDDFTKGSVNQHILIIRMIDPRLRFYVHNCICSPYVQKYIKGNAVGDKEGFSAGRCKNMLIPLPPLEEQTRIVEKINELLANM